jgi:hypothetical protein
MKKTLIYIHIKFLNLHHLPSYTTVGWRKSPSQGSRMRRTGLGEAAASQRILSRDNRRGNEVDTKNDS